MWARRSVRRNYTTLDAKQFVSENCRNNKNYQEPSQQGLGIK